MQTHISENLKEIEWVKELFPERKGYLDVYDHYQLLGERSVFAHGVHLCDDECARLAETGSGDLVLPDLELVPRQRPVQPADGREAQAERRSGH